MKPPSEWETLAKRMQWARAEKGWTQQEVARRAHVRQSTIGNIEAGTRERPREILEIAAALEVDPYWLGLGIGQPRKEGQPLLRPEVLEFAMELQKLAPEQVKNMRIAMTLFGPAVPDGRVEQAYYGRKAPVTELQAHESQAGYKPRTAAQKRRRHG